MATAARTPASCILYVFYYMKIPAERQGFCRAKNGTRTRDPQLGKLMLYQLSYFRNSEYKVTPLFRIRKSCARKNAGYPSSSVLAHSRMAHRAPGPFEQAFLLFSEVMHQRMPPPFSSSVQREMTVSL